MDFESLMLWSRAQFALTAIYHWLFVPLTLGLGIIMSLAETQYYRTNDDFWKKSAKFWQKLFGINFAIGVATGIILEFEFGTNWSNYSTFVGDIFGAPLAIEGILAFFMESTFIAVMFFGWGKVSKGFHLASTWLTIIGATISAIWILVANAWMQNPVGMELNPETMRSEMTDFWAVALSPTAINKFFHTVTSSWTLGSAFAVGVCAIYALKKKNLQFVGRNLKVIAPFGLIAALLTASTGHTSTIDIAKKQPMKMAAVEALYEAGTNDAETLECADGKGLGLSAIGMLKPSFDFRAEQNNITKESANPYLFNIEIPRLLSLLLDFNGNSYTPGVNNILKGDYYYKNDQGENVKALSLDERMQRGRLAISALKDFRQAKRDKNTEQEAISRAKFEENFDHFGYGYFEDKSEAVPNVPLTYYSFRVMVGAGTFFILVFALLTFFAFHCKTSGVNKKWLMTLAIIAMPLAWIASEAGWVVAEMGRQPWAIQDLLPVKAAVSKLAPTSVILTFTLFAVLFTAMLIAELNIMKKAIKAGPDSH